MFTEEWKASSWQQMQWREQLRVRYSILVRGRVGEGVKITVEVNGFVDGISQ